MCVLVCGSFVCLYGSVCLCYVLRPFVDLVFYVFLGLFFVCLLSCLCVLYLCVSCLCVSVCVSSFVSAAVLARVCIACSPAWPVGPCQHCLLRTCGGLGVSPENPPCSRSVLASRDLFEAAGTGSVRIVRFDVFVAEVVDDFLDCVFNDATALCGPSRVCFMCFFVFFFFTGG